jgi:hypothetical protein
MEPNEQNAPKVFLFEDIWSIKKKTWPKLSLYEPIQSLCLVYTSAKCSGLWYLTPLSTIFQLYRGGQFY